MSKIVIILILLFSVLISCSPDRFTLNVNEEIAIYGLIMSGLESAEKPDEYSNALHLRSNARIALAAPYLTQFESRFTVEIKKGGGLKFSIRTISDNFDAHPRIQFLYDSFGSTIYENDRKIIAVDSIKATAMEKKLIRLSNYGDYYTITVDCDTVITGRTKLPATEYVIIETLDDTEIFISGIKFAEIYGKRTIYE
jgi:hypothetical protein